MTQTVNLESMGRGELLATVRRLLAEADALSSRISAVNEIGVAMNRTLDLATIERVVAKQAKWLLDFAHCSVCLAQGDDWRIRTLFGPQEPECVDLACMDNINRTLESGTPQLIREGSDSPFLAEYASQLIIPLQADDTLLGTINFATQEPNSYTHDDMRIGYMLSLQLSSAIRNANVVRELQRTQDELRLRVEELDAYGHTIAHDLKSPLSSILLRSQMFGARFDGKVPVEALDSVRSIEQSSQMMHRMIDQLLWLAKLRHTDEGLQLVEVRAAIDAALHRFAYQLEHSPITVHVAPDIPDACGHAQWIEEVFANLIGNAIKYMGTANPQPSITIRGAVQHTCVRYEVTDTGMGIKPEDRESLFVMFTRLHNVETDGLGLGLSIVHRIIRKLGGAIGVESEYGKGSTFWFTLPTKRVST